jgi:hypothetical protein
MSHVLKIHSLRNNGSRDDALVRRERAGGYFQKLHEPKAQRSSYNENVFHDCCPFDLPNKQTLLGIFSHSLYRLGCASFHSLLKG